MYYVLMMHKGDTEVILKTKSYDTAYSVGFNLMHTMKREVIIVQPNKAPIIIKYLKG